VRFVLDTCVLVAALTSDRGASLGRQSWPQPPSEAARAGCGQNCPPQKPKPTLWRLRLKEPADEMVLETAVNGRVAL
jgi:hypothetical protein